MTLKEICDTSNIKIKKHYGGAVGNYVLQALRESGQQTEFKKVPEGFGNVNNYPEDLLPFIKLMARKALSENQKWRGDE